MSDDILIDFSLCEFFYFQLKFQMFKVCLTNDYLVLAASSGYVKIQNFGHIFKEYRSQGKGRRMDI